jgi:hypothetical protein
VLVTRELKICSGINATKVVTEEETPSFQNGNHEKKDQSQANLPV